VIKTGIFSLQGCLTSEFVSDCQTALKNHGLENISCSIRYETCFWDLWQLF